MTLTFQSVLSSQQILPAESRHGASPDSRASHGMDFVRSSVALSTCLVRLFNDQTKDP